MNARVRYEAAYRYDGPVSFSQHTIRLFPRQDHALQVRAFAFRTNDGADTQHRRDVFDNAIISAFYPEEARALVISVDMTLRVSERNPFHFLLDPSALHFPFQYSRSKARLLAPYRDPPSRRSLPALPFWSPPTRDDPRPTVETLISLNQAIADHIRYERRDTGAARDPAETIEAGVGACRDVAVLFAAVLRSHGLACRLASGYLCEFDLPEEERRAEAALHAWAEVYLPGAGWVPFDPTNGVLCDHNFISAAVGATPDDIAPVAGHYFSPDPVNSTLDATVTIEHLPD